MTDYHISEAKSIVFQGKVREICPQCYTECHPQEEVEWDYEKGENDCKNVFFVWDIMDMRKIEVGQCCCFSKVHRYNGGKSLWKK